MDNKLIIQKTKDFVKKTLEGEGSGHDFWHVYRVWKMSVNIGKKEKADIFVVELAALLHDIADWKFNNGDDEKGSKLASQWLTKLNVDKKVIDQVCFIVQHISYKGGTNKIKMHSIEGMVVQDADRLDAIGAIGIARAFTYGGYAKAKMHDPTLKPMKFNNFQEFRESMKVNTVINHFYEKLLLLKDLMNTKSAKRIAGKRHKLMEDYLDNFYKEWKGKQ